MSSVMELQGVVTGTRGKKASLADDLRREKLPVLPKEDVETFKREEVAANRQGVWRWLWPLAAFYRKTVPYVLAFALALAAGSLGWMQLHGTGRVAEILFWISGGIFLAYAGVLILLFQHRNSAFERAATRWEKMPFAKYAEEWYTFIPPRMTMRARIVEEELGGKTYVEYYNDDPFLVAERGPWWNREREYIGAWFTGRRDFDIV